jgi:hypothetical protein
MTLPALARDRGCGKDMSLDEITDWPTPPSTRVVQIRRLMVCSALLANGFERYHPPAFPRDHQREISVCM